MLSLLRARSQYIYSTSKKYYIILFEVQTDKMTSGSLVVLARGPLAADISTASPPFRLFLRLLLLAEKTPTYQQKSKRISYIRWEIFKCFLQKLHPLVLTFLYVYRYIKVAVFRFNKILSKLA